MVGWRCGCRASPARSIVLRSVILCFTAFQFMPSDLDQDALLTELELEAFLDISRTTVWRLRREAGLPFGRVGRQYRYRKSEVLQWLQDARHRDSQFHLKFPVRGK